MAKDHGHIDNGKIRVLYFAKYSTQADKIQKKKVAVKKSKEVKSIEEEKMEIESQESEDQSVRPLNYISQSRNFPPFNSSTEFSLFYFIFIAILDMYSIPPEGSQSLIPSPSQFQFNPGFEGFGCFDHINSQLLDIRQHQASTINTLDVLTHDVTYLKEERSGNLSARGRGGKRGRGRGRR